VRGKTLLMSLRPDFYCPERRPLFRGAVREKAYPVMRMLTGTFVLVVQAALRPNSMKELIEIVSNIC
jgi:tripartite-type tricarboxylate transporter receptor subunit TctC